MCLTINKRGNNKFGEYSITVITLGVSHDVGETNLGLKEERWRSRQIFPNMRTLHGNNYGIYRSAINLNSEALFSDEPYLESAV